MNSLLSQSFCAIKNIKEKEYASEITIGSMTNLSNETLLLLQGKTKYKNVCMDLSDELGSHIIFNLHKQSGYIMMTFHKKRSFSCNIMFISLENEILDTITYKTNSLSNLIVEIILNEFPYICRNYLKNGMRKKTKIINTFISELVQYHNNMNISCNINNVSIINI